VVGSIISGVVGSGISCMVRMEILVDSFYSRSVPGGGRRGRQEEIKKGKTGVA
jgi:hypothetical protein